MDNMDQELPSYEHIVDWDANVELLRKAKNGEIDCISVEDIGKLWMIPDKNGLYYTVRNNTLEWYADNKCHRDNEPATISAESVFYFKNGNYWHPTDQIPGIIYKDGGFEFGRYKTIKHKVDGPYWYADMVGEYGWQINNNPVSMEKMVNWGDENGINVFYPNEDEQLLIEMKWS